MKKTVNLFSIYTIVGILIGCNLQNKQLLELPDENLNFIVISDMWRPEKTEQKKIAKIMGDFAEQNEIDFIATTGDIIHYCIIKSVYDEDLNQKFENIYSAKSLHDIPWYVVLGNHEYDDDVQTYLDYSEVSKRWNMPAYYYSITKKLPPQNEECLFVFIDTTPLIDRYRGRAKNPDVEKQDMAAQLEWIETTLSSSSAKWKIVVGHHPVYAEDTDNEESEKVDMQSRVEPLLEKYDVDFYISGHVHNFQHIKNTASNVHFVVNSSASKTRPVKEIEGTLFCDQAPGFSVFSVSTDSVQLFFVNHMGITDYEYTFRK